MKINFGGRAGIFDGEIYVVPREDVDKQMIHEVLHVVFEGLEVSNNTFTEALCDVLCGRDETGLWFAEEAYNVIKGFIEGEKRN